MLKWEHLRDNIWAVDKLYMRGAHIHAYSSTLYVTTYSILSPNLPPPNRSSYSLILPTYLVLSLPLPFPNIFLSPLFSFIQQQSTIYLPKLFYQWFCYIRFLNLSYTIIIPIHTYPIPNIPNIIIAVPTIIYNP